MLSLPEVWALISKWGSVAGVTFDIVGAILVYHGVRIKIEKATAIEHIVLNNMIDDLGSPAVREANERLSAERASERVRGSRWAGIGLAFFVIGFVLQGLGSWPK